MTTRELLTTTLKREACCVLRATCIEQEKYETRNTKHAPSIVVNPKKQEGTNMDAKKLITGVSKSVSQIALGTAFYNIDSKEEWFNILDDYIKAGGTILDTARGYRGSEEVLGLWMENRSTRDQIIIQTKCGLTGGDGYLPAGNFPEVVREEITTSLQALRTDYIDVLMLHRDNQ